MSKAPSMPVFTDALIGDTTDLSIEEFGAYTMLLFVTWRNNGVPLPDDSARMARICRMSEKRWTEKIRPVVMRFFDLSEGIWRLAKPEHIAPTERLPWASWSSIRQEVFARDGAACLYCGDSTGPFECDHITPISRGGSNDLSNLATACAPCNREKGNKTLQEWRGQ